MWQYFAGQQWFHRLCFLCSLLTVLLWGYCWRCDVDQSCPLVALVKANLVDSKVFLRVFANVVVGSVTYQLNWWHDFSVYAAILTRFRPVEIKPCHHEEKDGETSATVGVQQSCPPTTDHT